jgi:hypothetical protein
LEELSATSLGISAELGGKIAATVLRNSYNYLKFGDILTKCFFLS